MPVEIKVPPGGESVTEARKWIGRAAAQGHADARAYMQGTGP